MSKIQLNHLSTQPMCSVYLFWIIWKYWQDINDIRADHTVIAVIPSKMCLASHDQMTESNAQNIQYSNYAHTNTFNRKRFTMFRCFGCDNYFVGKTIFVIYINNSLNMLFYMREFIFRLVQCMHVVRAR